MQRSPALETYKNTLRSPKTQKAIHNKLDQVFNALDIPGSSIEQRAEFFAKKAKSGRWLEDKINNFVKDGRERVEVKKDLAAVTLKLYFYSMKSFCEMNDLGLTLNWRRIAKGLPKGANEADDRPFTTEEIRRLMKHADRRLKTIVYILCSSGIRAGAFEFLNWGHVKPITKWQYLTWKKGREEARENHDLANKIIIPEQEEDKQTIIAAMLKVYAGEAERYFAFISPEAYFILKDYMDFRRDSGENVNKDSCLIRKQWQTVNVNNRTKQGRIKNPERLIPDSIEKELQRAEKKEGIHPDLPPGVRRHETKTSHGFRKFWETAADEVGLRDTRVAQLRGDTQPHNAGHYRRPHDYVKLEDYLKMVDLVTIDQDRRKAALLQEQMTLQEKQHQQEMEESRREYAEAKNKLAAIAERMNNLETSLGDKEKLLEQETRRVEEQTSTIDKFEKMLDEVEQWKAWLQTQQQQQQQPQQASAANVIEK